MSEQFERWAADQLNRELQRVPLPAPMDHPQRQSRSILLNGLRLLAVGGVVALLLLLSFRWRSVDPLTHTAQTDAHTSYVEPWMWLVDDTDRLHGIDDTGKLIPMDLPYSVGEFAHYAHAYSAPSLLVLADGDRTHVYDPQTAFSATLDFPAAAIHGLLKGPADQVVFFTLDEDAASEISVQILIGNLTTGVVEPFVELHENVATEKIVVRNMKKTEAGDQLELEYVTTDKFGLRIEAWDGSSVIFSTYGQLEHSWRRIIWRADTQSGTLERLFDAETPSAYVSADGKHVAYVQSLKSSEQTLTSYNRIMSLDLESKVEKVVSEHAQLGFTLAPDGSKIVYTQQHTKPATDTFDVLLYDVQTNTSTVLGRDYMFTHSIAQFVWQPGSDRVALAYTQNDQSHVVVFDVSNGQRLPAPSASEPELDTIIIPHTWQRFTLTPHNEVVAWQHDQDANTATVWRQPLDTPGAARAYYLPYQFYPIYFPQ